MPRTFPANLLGRQKTLETTLLEKFRRLLARIGPGNGLSDSLDIVLLRGSVKYGIQSLVYAKAPFRNVYDIGGLQQEQPHKAIYFSVDANKLKEFREAIHEQVGRFGPSENHIALGDKTLLFDTMTALIELESFFRQKQREYEALETTGGRRSRKMNKRQGRRGKTRRV